MNEVTKNAPQQAIKNLGRAYANFFEDLVWTNVCLHAMFKW